MTTITYIALYCRVSTDEQAHEGVSLSEQQSRLTSYCAAQGWDRESNLRLYIDDGYSGKNLHRPALSRLLDDLQHEPFARLLVTKLDRLSRRLLDLLSLIELLETQHVALVSTSEAFDTATPSGRLTLQVLGAVAEFERERIRERVIDNMAHAAKSGRWLARPPYGYRLDAKVLVVNEGEAAVVRKVFFLFIEEHLGYYQIAGRLNEEGVASREKKTWSSNAIKKILTNPVYTGTVVWNRDQVAIVAKDAHPALIDDGQFALAKARAARGASTGVADRRRHLLSGLLRCSLCDSRMYGGTAGSRGLRRVYRCAARRSGGVCRAKAIAADDVEAAFLEGLAELFQAVQIGRVRVEWRDSAEVVRQRLHKRLRQCERREERWLRAYVAGGIDANRWQKEREQMAAQREEWNRTLVAWEAEAVRRAHVANEAVRTALDVSTAFALLSEANLRTWIEGFVEAASVIDDGLQIQLRSDGVK